MVSDSPNNVEDTSEPSSSSSSSGEEQAAEKVISLHWFRQDLRVHDNPALLEALKDCDEFYPVFIFDGKVASMLYPSDDTFVEIRYRGLL